MTTTPTAPLTLDAAPEIAAIQEALAAGPTPGPWKVEINGIGTHVFASKEVEVYPRNIADLTIPFWAATDPDDSHGVRARVHADTKLIAACNPAAMTAVLATIAQLEARLREAEAVIRDHNAGCESQCEQRQQNGTASCPYAQYGRQCPDCPRDWLLDAAIASTKGETS